MRALPAWLCGFAVVIVAGVPARCDHGILPGHSHLGPVYDRSPRQRAYLMGGTGNQRFPVTSKNPLVQKFVEQGVGQLHGFWYVEAERSFREAARLDPNCGIAYWGMSLANETLNPGRAKQFAAEAARHKTGLTDREQLYIDAIGKADGYRKLLERYPDDLEARAFEVWRVWHKYEAGMAMQPEMDRALGLLHTILKTNPMHPVNHAVIHIVDEGDDPQPAYDSAEVSGESAPSVAHMWHMPAHTYSAAKRYPEAAWQMEAALRTDHARMMRDHIIPDQVHLYAHNSEWFVRTLSLLGRVHDARRVALQMVDLPRHPLFNMLEPPEVQIRPQKKEKDNEGEKEEKEDKLTETRGSSSYYGRERLLQVLREYECWEELIRDFKSGYIEATHVPAEQGRAHLNLGIAYYRLGDVANGDAELAAIKQLFDEERNQSRNAPRTGRTRSRAPVADKRMGPTLPRLKSQINSLEWYRNTLFGFFLGRGRLVLLLVLLLAAETAAVWFLRRRLLLAALTAVAVAPIAGWLISRHLALTGLPYEIANVDFTLVARKQLEAGDYDDAEWVARNFAKERPNQVRPQATLVEVLHGAGKKEEAREEFEKLREMAGTADLDGAPFARLAPIAHEFGFPTDWRRPEKIAASLSGRRPLPSLGPLLWRPWKAPEWTLKDAGGKEHALAEFRGKPVILVFFLGGSCLHCQQQLTEFAKRKEFAAAGLTVVTISTDDEAAINKSLSTFKPEFPFLMLADPKLKVFQSYGAYDDFEHIALHGTFLIDKDGYLRWNDVAAEPFMDADFLIGESKRLLGRPIAPVEIGARVIVGLNGEHSAR
jgi:peroxiredoxin